MSLRLRLLLGYGYLVGLLLLVAGSATLGFLHLSAGIDVVLEENFRSIQASMEMLEALERQDSETLAGLLEGVPRDEELAVHERTFVDALRIAQANVTEEDENEVLGRIRDAFESYRRSRDVLLAAPPDRPLAEYNRAVFPSFTAVKSGVLRLLEINQAAMVRAERQARSAAVQNGAWLGFLVLLALLSLILLSRVLQRQVLSRLNELREGIEAIAAGHGGRRLRETGNDELTLIARRTNELLDRHQKLEARTNARLAEERRLTVSLVDALGPGVAVFGLDGRCLIGSLEGDEDAVATWIEGEGRERLDSREPRHVAGRTGPIEVRALLASTGRPLAWLARRSRPTDSA